MRSAHGHPRSISLYMLRRGGWLVLCGDEGRHPTPDVCESRTETEVSSTALSPTFARGRPNPSFFASATFVLSLGDHAAVAGHRRQCWCPSLLLNMQKHLDLHAVPELACRTIESPRRRPIPRLRFSYSRPTIILTTKSCHRGQQRESEKKVGRLENPHLIDCHPPRPPPCYLIPCLSP